MSAPVRVVIVGARRVRQGTGPFLALHAAAAGAEVAGVLATTAHTAAAASAGLRDRGLDVRAYHEWSRMIADERPDAVFIASPAATHAEYLERALAAGCHVLCEKPLLVGAGAGAPNRASPEQWVAAFRSVQRLLIEACQWPFTLSAFRELHPEVELARVERFSMTLAPPVAGREALVECLSHPLSLLQAIAPRGRVKAPGRIGPEPPDDEAVARFLFETCSHRLEAEFRAVATEEFPRPALYSLDGHVCRRRLEQPGYRFFFDNGLPEDRPDYRKVAAADPMAALVEAFLAAVAAARSGGPLAADPGLPARQHDFWKILSAHDGR